MKSFVEPEGVSELLGDSVCERTLSEGSENIAGDVFEQSIAEKLSQNSCALYEIVSKCPKDVFIRKLIKFRKIICWILIN